MCIRDSSKPVKQEVNRTVILPPLVFPGLSIGTLRGTLMKRVDLTAIGPLRERLSHATADVDGIV